MTYYQGTTAGTLTNVTWAAWNCTGGATSATTDTTWQIWSADVTTCSNSVTVWAEWNGTTGQITNIRQTYPQPRELTPEERAANAARQKQAEAEAKEREKKRLKAEKAALKLFVGIVGRRAYGYFKKRGYHEVIGHSGKRYRVRLQHRVEEMVGNFGDQIAAYLCIHSDYQYGLPPMDTLVQQMLLVMSGDEGEKVLHRTANRTQVAVA